MNWEKTGDYEWRCVAYDGRIVARITMVVAGEYAATYDDSSVGLYVSLETAQKAVENRARPYLA